jgi:hypothetical protein
MDRLRDFIHLFAVCGFAMQQALLLAALKAAATGNGVITAT